MTANAYTEVDAPAIRRQISALLGDARDRTLELVEPLSDEVLTRIHTPILSPLMWDLGHVANFEELWLVQTVGGREPLRAELGEIYDAFQSERPERGALEYLKGEGCRDYMEAVRERTLEVLEATELNGADPLLREGFVYELVIRHEQQHNETMLQALQMINGEGYRPQRRLDVPTAGPVPAGMVGVPAGAFEMGAAPGGFAYDNERALHARELGDFLIDAAPVTNGDYLEFMAAGGYARPELWDRNGWDWRRREGIEAPLYWEREQTGYVCRRLDSEEVVEGDRPVVHVSWYEADAYARWAGKRLPTEAEWEKAATWDPAGERKRAYPWGDEPVTAERANLDQLRFGCAPVGAYPEGASAYGCHQMLGDVWEWTASDFRPYRGFEAFPYEEYSTPFFGSEYRVLRGGSWATRPRSAPPTFRNWDYPVRRQIFAGFRCAADPED